MDIQYWAVVFNIVGAVFNGGLSIGFALDGSHTMSKFSAIFCIASICVASVANGNWHITQSDMGFFSSIVTFIICFPTPESDFLR